MKCKVIVLSILMLVMVAMPIAAESEPPSAVEEVSPARVTVFRDLAWGDPPEMLGDSYDTMNAEPPGIDIWRKYRDELSLGSLRLYSIEYHFFQNRLMRVVVTSATTDGETYDAFERMLTIKYGKPTARLFSNNRDWQYGDTLVHLVWPIFGDLHFILESRYLKQEYDAWLDQYKKEQAASNAQTF